MNALRSTVEVQDLHPERRYPRPMYPAWERVPTWAGGVLALAARLEGERAVADAVAARRRWRTARPGQQGRSPLSVFRVVMGPDSARAAAATATAARTGCSRTAPPSTSSPSPQGRAARASGWWTPLPRWPGVGPHQSVSSRGWTTSACHFRRIVPLRVPAPVGPFRNCSSQAGRDRPTPRRLAHFDSAVSISGGPASWHTSGTRPTAAMTSRVVVEK